MLASPSKRKITVRAALWSKPEYMMVRTLIPAVNFRRSGGLIPADRECYKMKRTLYTPKSSKVERRKKIDRFSLYFSHRFGKAD
jgi:hypothetical protein